MKDVVFDAALARTVADFVVALPPDLRLIVHCYAGISRSAGMVAGIAEALEDGEVAHACHVRYVPNRLVKELTFAAFRTAS